MLGVKISQDLSFVPHLISLKDSVLVWLKKRLGSLKQLRRVSSFKTRLSIANAIFMSVLTYSMPVWAGAPGYVLAALPAGRNWQAETEDS